MPCIWGKHNNSQIFLDVAVVPITSNSQTEPPPRFRALLDTGAQLTFITSAVATKMGLSSIGMIPVQGVSGVQNHHAYLFQVGLFRDISVAGSDGDLVSQSVLSILSKDIAGAEFNSMTGEFEVLLGMDVISIGSLKVEGNGTFSFSF